MQKKKSKRKVQSHDTPPSPPPPLTVPYRGARASLAPSLEQAVEGPVIVPLRVAGVPRLTPQVGLLVPPLLDLTVKVLQGVWTVRRDTPPHTHTPTHTHTHTHTHNLLNASNAQFTQIQIPAKLLKTYALLLTSMD